VLNWIIRYQPVMRLLKEQDANRVLDVGSGWHGLSWYWPRDVVQTDLAFQGDNPWHGRPGTAHFVGASAESLPFPSDTFDFVVSLDTLEHLPQNIRASFVDELARVSRQGVIIGYPVGRSAQRVDRTLHRLFRIIPRMTVPTWLQEHVDQVDYPTPLLLQSYLPSGWAVAKEIGNENAYLAVVRAVAELAPGLRGVCDRLEARACRRGVPSWVNRGTTYRTIYLVSRIDPGEPLVSRSVNG
jgi:SAM-dependent methyltransferase